MANDWTYGSDVDLTNGGSDDLDTVEILTSLPSGLLEIEIFLGSASLGSDNQYMILQLGDVDGYHTTGYQSAATNGATAGGNVTAGFANALDTATDAADTTSGMYRMYRFATAQHKWLCDYMGAEPGVGTRYAFGTVNLDKELTRIQITTVGGTALFDNGTIRGRYR
jgi:hypothetical protein